MPETVRARADKSFALLRENPQHPSLHFKRIGRYWSARIGLNYRALAVAVLSDELPMPSATYELFREAILGEKQVVCVYQGYHHELCPLIIGHTGGKERVLAPIRR